MFAGKLSRFIIQIITSNNSAELFTLIKMGNKTSRVQIFLHLELDLWTSGDTIKGAIYLNAEEDAYYGKLDILFVGRESIGWSISVGDGSENMDKFEYKQKLQLFDFGTCISKGQYEIPFSILLPDSLPGSFYFNSQNHIKYHLQAQLIHASNTNFNISQTVKVQILQPARIKQVPIYQQALIPITHSCCCREYGEADVILSADKSWVFPGDKLFLKGSIKNKSGVPIKQFKVKIINKVVIVSKYQKSLKVYEKKHWNLHVVKEKFYRDHQNQFQICVDVPDIIRTPSAIGKIIANYYYLVLQAMTDKCIDNPAIIMHLPIFANNPKFRKTHGKELRKLAKEWNPTILQFRHFNNMPPYILQNDFGIPFKNILNTKHPNQGYPPSFRPAYSSTPPSSGKITPKQEQGGRQSSRPLKSS